MNQEHLQTLIDTIKEDAGEHFDMEHYFYNDGDPSKKLGDCGTAACIAGWAGYLLAKELRLPYFHSKGEADLSQYLEIGYDLAVDIAHGNAYVWKDFIATFLKRGHVALSEITWQEAVALLESFQEKTE